MTKQRQTRTTHPLLLAICGFAWLLASLMILPVFTALAAGLAALSIVIYGFMLICLLCCIPFTSHRMRLMVWATIGLTVFALVIPQLGFLSVAATNHVRLRFNPIDYLTFSGETTLKPSRTIVYKTTARHRLKLAIYEPSAVKRNGSTVILLHGGGWRYGDYRETGMWPERLRDAGFTVISTEYRLSSDTYHTWRDAPADVHDAVTYIRQNTVQLDIDPLQLHLLGQSAGGHLALLEAYRHADVRQVVALYAPIDLELDYRTSRDKSAELDFIGGPPSQYPDRYRSVSPLSYVARTSPETLLIQGTTDDLVSVSNSRLLASELHERGVSHELLILPLTGHSFENQRGGFATQIAIDKTIRFLNR